MFSKKTAITLASLASLSLCVPSGFASTSIDFNGNRLKLQMERQAAIDIQAAESQYRMAIAERMATIRARNQGRRADIQYRDQFPAHTPAVVAVASIFPEPKMTTLQMPITHVAPSASPTTHPSTPTPAASQYIGNIDMARVQEAWLGWTNALRSEAGLHPYTLHPALNATAQEWSNFSRDRGYITHGRPGDGCVGERNWWCYNFSAVDTWFRDRGVNPKVVDRTKHTENLGIGAFRCTLDDCTEQAIQAIRKTYNFFHSEKSYNGVHYRSMMHNKFQHIGVGLAEKNGTYYLTVHYATEL